MAFKPGQSGNLAGRPKVLKEDKPTNRSLREKAFLELVRKFRPLQAKAIAAAVAVLDNKESQDTNKLKSAALIIGTYKDLIKETYDYKYDLEEAVPMQEENKPVFSLKIVGNEETNEGN